MLVAMAAEQGKEEHNLQVDLVQTRDNLDLHFKVDLVQQVVEVDTMEVVEVKK